jgi:hypothetical protein
LFSFISEKKCTVSSGDDHAAWRIKISIITWSRQGMREVIVDVAICMCQLNDPVRIYRVSKESTDSSLKRRDMAFRLNYFRRYNRRIANVRKGPT